MLPAIVCNKLRNTIKATYVAKRGKETLPSNEFHNSITSLKKQNRLVQFILKKARDSTSNKRIQVDQTHLNLQNIVYEMQHLQDEIDTCLSYKSKHEELSILSESDYDSMVGSDDSHSPHKKTLSRLFWELDQRKCLKERSDSLDKSVIDLFEQIKSKKDYLDGHLNKVKELLDSTKQLQSIYDMPLSLENDQYSLAFLLPNPLYLKSFSNLVHDNSIKVEIRGDEDAAKAFNSTDEHKEQENAESDEERAEKKKRRKSKLSEADNVAKNLIISHPLDLKFTLTTTSYDGEIYLSIVFYWLPKIRLVTAKVSVEGGSSLDQLLSNEEIANLFDVNTLLSNLDLEGSVGNVPIKSTSFSFDWPKNASSSTNLADAPQLSINQPIDWNQCPLGRPFFWVQHLAGLVCLPVLTHDTSLMDTSHNDRITMTPKTDFIGNLIKTINRRCLSRVQLMKELYELKSGSAILRPHQKSLSPENLCISDFIKSSSEEFFDKFSRAKLFKELGLVQDSDSIFFCTIKVLEKVDFKVWIVVPSEYPTMQSILMVDNLSQELFPGISQLHLTELESQVNCSWREYFNPEEIKSNNLNLITCQMYRLSACAAILMKKQALSSRPTSINYPSRPHPVNYFSTL
ncbi:THO complex subunit 5 [Cichlidogyrus casuarinus]|uniref:THO complex subunit 5 n=1 Tax=Cichlidogyrus casuarinus TaxID=1844966 RepID=A0ABD2QJR7_9PLAT